MSVVIQLCVSWFSNRLLLAAASIIFTYFLIRICYCNLFLSLFSVIPGPWCYAISAPVPSSPFANAGSPAPCVIRTWNRQKKELQVVYAARHARQPSLTSITSKCFIPFRIGAAILSESHHVLVSTFTPLFSPSLTHSLIDSYYVSFLQG